ncbi:MAG TPA: penicillin-binding transpeptidase domain-containing protein [Solirubrobacterales bacterium]|nr:penicillin-binding transpeptidase domain-containing protein [Solirubrobacterales bacterium]
MNRQIIKLFAFIIVLFAVLIGFTSWWSVFDAKGLKASKWNQRPLLEQQQIPRGRILAADGTVIAKSFSKGHGSGKRYIRHYPLGALFGHPIGYSFVQYGQSEFEKYHNAELTGEESEFGAILDQLTGKTQEGEQIVTNLDVHAQEVAMGDLEAAGYGAVVAIEPSTGAVKVLASNPSYNPNSIPKEGTLAKLNKAEVSRPLYNRATQGQYPPGSTFKVVTAAAGLESGVITPETTINAPGTIIDEGHELANDFNQDWGSISLDTALTNSVNTWFGQLGQKVGQDKLFTTMEKFGFNAKPPIDLPEDELSKSGVYDYESGKMLTRNDPVDLARVAIGQERLLATPLQIAMVAAGVANGGKLMKPQIWNRVVNADGSVTKRMNPEVYSEPISAKTAEELTTAMEGVVREGTGTNAAISGVPVAGKTGTAETPGNTACGGGEEENQAWFMGFAPANDPKIAIAASVECTEQFGNDVAAPIFRDVAEAILAGE